MPLIAVAILSYGAGLLGGFGLGATLTGVCGVAIALGSQTLPSCTAFVSAIRAPDGVTPLSPQRCIGTRSSAQAAWHSRRAR